MNDVAEPREAQSDPKDPAPAVKPAWKSTEAYLSLATSIFGALVTSGFIADGSTAARIIGGILTFAGMAIHSWSRTTLKAGS